METRQISDPAGEIQAKVSSYFGNVDHSVQVMMVGRIADAIIWYQDFKPARIVRRELEEKFENLNISEIKRTYSDKTRLAILQELLDADETIYLPYEDGSLRPLCIGALVEEKLYHRSL
jgi:hypothetical protein